MQKTTAEGKNMPLVHQSRIYQPGIDPCLYLTLIKLPNSLISKASLMTPNFSYSIFLPPTDSLRSVFFLLSWFPWFFKDMFKAHLVCSRKLARKWKENIIGNNFPKPWHHFSTEKFKSLIDLCATRGILVSKVQI